MLATRYKTELKAAVEGLAAKGDVVPPPAELEGKTLLAEGEGEASLAGGERETSLAELEGEASMAEGEAKTSVPETKSEGAPKQLQL